MADRRLPDLKARLTIDVSDLELTKARAAELAASLKGQFALIQEAAARLQAEHHVLSTATDEVGATSDRVASGPLPRLHALFQEQVRIVAGAATEAEKLARQTEGVDRSMRAATPAVAGASGGFAAMAGGMGPVLTVVTGLLVAMPGLIPVVLGLAAAVLFAASALVAFTVGAAATLAIVGLIAAVSVGGAAGLLLLAHHAGQASDAFSKLQTDLQGVLDHLGKLAAGPAKEILTWLDHLLPLLDRVGNQLINWFGPRLPAILDIATKAINLMVAAWERFGPGFSKLFDEVIARSPQFLAIFDKLAGFGVDAILGLLRNLLRLSDWFIVRLPLFEPIINQIFGGLGTWIQKAAEAFGRFVDWIITHWPEIVRFVQMLWDCIVTGYTLVKPLLDQFTQNMRDMAPVLKFIRDHAEDLKLVLYALGLVVGILIGVFEAFIIIGILVVAAFIGIIEIAKALWKATEELRRQFGTQMEALGTAARTAQHDIGGAFSGIGGGAHDLAVAVGVAAGQFGTQMSALGTAARTAQHDIGAAFSAIGSAANGMQSAVGSAFSSLGTTVHQGLVQVGGVFDRFGGAVNSALGGFSVHIPALGKFAQGGVVPGYAPGQDSVLALLSPGEGVLTPQTTRALGGPGGIDALNQMGAGIGATLGTWGGQCVPFVEKMLGTYWPVAFASQLTRYMNSATAKAGEAAVFTGGLYGHVALVTGPGDGYSFPVIDSNWVGPETIGTHTMNKGMYGWAGFIDTGAKLGTLAGIPGITAPIDLLNGLVGKALGGLGGWQGSFAKSILEHAVTGITHSLGFDQGGQLPPGPSMVWNGTGRPENVSTADTMDDVKQLLQAIHSELQSINGRPRLSGLLAQQRAG